MRFHAPDVTPDPRLPAAACTWLLLIAMGLGFLLQQVTSPVFELKLALWPVGCETWTEIGGNDYRVGFDLWQLLTYGFLHGGFTHLLFNGLALWSFGPAVEQVLGSRRFARYVLLCIVGAGIAQLITLHFTLEPREFVPTIGASGGVFGVLFAFGFLFPKRIIIPLFPPIPMPAWLAVTAFGAIELYLGISNSVSSIAHFAHLGGMVVGFGLFRYWIARGVLQPFPSR